MHGSKSQQSYFVSPPGSLDASMIGKSMMISLRIDTVSDTSKKAHGGSGSGISNWQLLPDIILDWDSGAFVYYMAFQPQQGLQQVDLCDGGVFLNPQSTLG
jgi:hypothetical protein